MATINSIKEAFPERAADLVQRYLDARLEEVLAGLSEWENEFAPVTASLSEMERKKIWHAAALRIYFKQPGYVEPDEHEIVLLFFLLEKVCSQWCSTIPFGFVTGARRIIEKTKILKERWPDERARIFATVRDSLKNVFWCSVVNAHPMALLVDEEVLSFQENDVFFFDGCDASLSSLINNYHASYDGLMSIWALRDRLSLSGERDAFIDEWGRQIKSWWRHLLSQPCLEAWKTSFTGSSQERRQLPGPEKFLAAFPAALDDADWLGWCVGEFARRAAMKDGFCRYEYEAPSIDIWVNCIEQFKCWSGSLAKRLFDAMDGFDADGFVQKRLLFETPKRILTPDSGLAESDRACIALAFLTREHERLAKMRDRPSEAAVKEFEALKDFVGELGGGRAILRVFSCLRDLPMERYGSDAVWSEFGPDEKAAWRTEVAEMVFDLTDIRHGLIEHLLWRTRSIQRPEGLYSEMELLVLGLCRADDDLEFLKGLETHVSRLVCVRAAALLARLGQAAAPSPFTPLPEDGVTAAAASQALTMLGDVELPCRTWMQDKSVERVIYAAVHEVEAAFSVEYENQWRLDEEMHLATLLTRLQGALRGSNGVLDALAAYGVGVAPRIEFSFRQISKHEEGSVGVGSDRFSVDVAFIVRVTDCGKTVTERAAFVQCKKLESNDRGVWKPSFEFKRDQCDDLIRQTESSFYMFLSPACIGREIWMTPARLVRNLADLGGGKGRLPHLPTYFASRSLAHWLTYDLFGLWTGDERKEILDKAAGAKPGWAPRFIVTVVIHRNPTHDEAPGRRPQSR